jgi:hypothetical protein
MTRQSVPESGRPASAREAGETRAPGSARPSEPRITRIARRAHEIYLARGGTDGKALDDWLQAEREIDAELDESGS